MRTASLLVTSFLFSAICAPAQVVINEVCYDSGMLPGAYAASDWIELYNRGDTPVNLKGYAVGDTNPYDENQGVRLPDYTLPPKGFLLVYAEGDGAEYTAWVDTPGGRIPIVHGQFRLSRAGERVHLFNADLTRVHMFDSPGYELGRNVSYGAYPDGSTTSFRVFTTPTPGRPNSEAVPPSGGVSVSDIGMYDGFLYGQGPFSALGNAMTVQGLLSLKVATEGGRLSAKVRTVKGTLSLSAQKWAVPSAEGSKQALLVARGGETLEISVENGRIQGRFFGGALGPAAYRVEGSRARLKEASDSAARRALEQVAGYYTVALPRVAAQSASEMVDAAPQGVGYLTLTVGARGQVKIAGQLADGSKVSSASSLLLPDIEGEVVHVPVFLPLYTRKGWMGVLLSLASDGRVAAIDTVDGWHAAWARQRGGADDFHVLMEVCGGRYNGVEDFPGGFRFQANLGPVPYHTRDAISEWSIAPDGVPVTVSGARLRAAKGDRPLTDESGRYQFSGLNPTSTVLSGSLRNGLFKGTFKLYYEWEAGPRIMHKALVIPYRGILVQECGGAFRDRPAGFGYCLVPDSDPALRGYRLKRSFGVSLVPE
ncbi:MAG TPA: lamin tail domain-containing protein [Kiritimatiellia bacterium]|nr:lamin tail domain-containing protein [Kiritimatiellia bacterium]HRU69755.1 lamin tail domain-containing protein [Kiritimatiellia bacterium]